MQSEINVPIPRLVYGNACMVEVVLIVFEFSMLVSMWHCSPCPVGPMHDAHSTIAKFRKSDFVKSGISICGQSSETANLTSLPSGTCILPDFQVESTERTGSTRGKNLTV